MIATARYKSADKLFFFSTQSSRQQKTPSLSLSLLSLEQGRHAPPWGPGGATRGRGIGSDEESRLLGHRDLAAAAATRWQMIYLGQRRRRRSGYWKIRSGSGCCLISWSHLKMDGSLLKLWFQSCQTLENRAINWIHEISIISFHVFKHFLETSVEFRYKCWDHFCSHFINIKNLWVFVIVIIKKKECI